MPLIMYKHYGGHPIGYKNLDKFYESNIFLYWHLMYLKSFTWIMFVEEVSIPHNMRIIQHILDIFHIDKKSD